MSRPKVNKLTNLDYWFNEYLRDHTSPGNIKTHYWGIPIVTVSLVGLLNQWISIPAGDVTIGGGLILMLIAMTWYFILDSKLALFFIIPFIVIYFAALNISYQLHIVLQILGWFLQLLGHYKYEGRIPAFLKSMPQLLIGPLFLFAKVIKYGRLKI